jgi:hypothetical protein
VPPLGGALLGGPHGAAGGRRGRARATGRAGDVRAAHSEGGGAGPAARGTAHARSRPLHLRPLHLRPRPLILPCPRCSATSATSCPCLPCAPGPPAPGPRMLWPTTSAPSAPQNVIIASVPTVFDPSLAPPGATTPARSGRPALKKHTWPSGGPRPVPLHAKARLGCAPGPPATAAATPALSPVQARRFGFTSLAASASPPSPCSTAPPRPRHGARLLRRQRAVWALAGGLQAAAGPFAAT